MLENSTEALQPEVMISEQPADDKPLQVWLVPSSIDSRGLPTQPPLYSPAQLLADQQTSIGLTLNRRKSENSVTQPDDCTSLMQSSDLKEIKKESVESTDSGPETFELESYSAEILRKIEKSPNNQYIPNVCSLAFIPGAGQQKNMCNICGKYFRSRQQLNQHTLVHTDVRKYKCNYCNRAFKQPSHLHQHHRIHTGEKPYKCPMSGCGRAFPQLSNLNHHLRNHDKPAPPSENTCIFCDRVYASDAVLRNHMAKIHCWKADDRLEGDVKQVLKQTRTGTCADPMAFFPPGSSLPLTLESRPMFVSTTPISCTFPVTPNSYSLTASIASLPQPPSLPRFLTKSKLHDGLGHSNERSDAVQAHEELDRQTNHTYSKTVDHRSSEQPSDANNSLSAMSNTPLTPSCGTHTDARVQIPCDTFPSGTYSRIYEPANSAVPNKMPREAANDNCLERGAASSFKTSKTFNSTRAIYSTIPLAKIKQTMNHYKSLQHRTISKREGSTDAKKGSDIVDDMTNFTTTEMNVDKDIPESLPCDRCPNPCVSSVRLGNDTIVRTNRPEIDLRNNLEQTMYEEMESDHDIEALRERELGHINNIKKSQGDSNFTLIDGLSSIQANCQTQLQNALHKYVGSVNESAASEKYSVFNLRNYNNIGNKKTDVSSCKINTHDSAEKHVHEGNSSRSGNQSCDYSSLSSNVQEEKYTELDHDSDEIREESETDAYGRDMDDFSVKYHYTLGNSVSEDDTSIQSNQKTTTKHSTTVLGTERVDKELPKSCHLTDNNLNVAEEGIAKECVSEGGVQSREQIHLVSHNKSRKRKSFQPHRVVYDRRSEFDYQY